MNNVTIPYDASVNVCLKTDHAECRPRMSIYGHEYIISQFSLFLDVIATQQSEQHSP